MSIDELLNPKNMVGKKVTYKGEKYKVVHDASHLGFYIVTNKEGSRFKVAISTAKER